MSTLSYASNNNWFLNVSVSSFYLNIFIAFNEHARKSYEMIKQNFYNMYLHVYMLLCDLISII